MRKLVIVTHPNIENSTINKTWLNELSNHEDQLNIHHLDKVYPDGKIDIKKEQELLEAHDEIIFQFPVFWFNIPAFLKKWLDEVLAYGWAFGPNGDKMQGKKVRIAASTGGTKETYEKGMSINHLLSNVTTSFQFCGCEVLPIHVFHGANFSPAPESIEKNAQEYCKLLLA